jgi:hypothetical protein
MIEAMTKTQFTELTLNDKIELVIEQGTELLNRVFLFYVIRLYNIDEFYVEVWYKTSSNKIDRIEPVDIDDVFHLYEKSIDIEDLFER